MGCTTSSDGTFQPERYDDLWKETIRPEKVPKKSHTTWKIMRINLISTFKDFRNERGLIHALLNDDEIKDMAKRKRVIIQLEDFNSGTKASAEDPESVYLLTDCIEEARVDNGHPYYIHLLGECLGYIIRDDFPDTEFLARYGLSRGLCLGEAALLLANIKNPNSLFLRRDNSFLREIPFYEPTFIEDHYYRKRANYFADKIGQTASSHYVEYTCSTEGINDPHHKNVILTDLDLMAKSVKEFILEHLESDFRPSANSDSVKETENGIPKAKLSPEQKQLAKEAVQQLTEKRIVVIQGDHGTGKTSILREIARKNSATFVDSSIQDNSLLEHISQSKNTVCIDDAHMLTKKQLLEIVDQITEKDGKLVIATRKRLRVLENDANKCSFIPIPALSPDQIQEIICQYSTFISPYEEKHKIERNFDAQSVELARNIAGLSTKETDENTIENGREGVGLTVDSAKIIGNLIRFGFPMKRIESLASRSPASICETDICAMESESRGHLLIATMCLLAISPGLTETQIRNLLAWEDGILPKAIHRRYRNLSFELNLTAYGGKRQVCALRWRYVRMRLSVHLILIDSDMHSLKLTNICKKAVYKKYLNKEENVKFFEKLLRRTCITPEDK